MTSRDLQQAACRVRLLVDKAGEIPHDGMALWEEVAGIDYLANQLLDMWSGDHDLESMKVAVEEIGAQCIRLSAAFATAIEAGVPS